MSQKLERDTKFAGQTVVSTCVLETRESGVFRKSARLYHKSSMKSTSKRANWLDSIHRQTTLLNLLPLSTDC